MKNYIVIISLLISVCACNNPAENELTDDVKNEIVQEISAIMNTYSNDVKNWDSDAIDNFWGDYEGFVFAGDGYVLGGHKEWSDLLDEYEKQVDRWLKFEYYDMYIDVLSKNAVSVTSEFEHSRITLKGDTVNIKGVWTYVFKKSDEKWNVVHTNGTHLEY